MAASVRDQDAQVGRAGTRDTEPESGPPMDRNPAILFQRAAQRGRVASAVWSAPPHQLARVIVVLEGADHREAIVFERGAGDRFSARRYREEGPSRWTDLGITVCSERMVAAACGVSSLADLARFQHPCADSIEWAPSGAADELWASLAPERDRLAYTQVRLTAFFGMETAQRVLEAARARAQAEGRPFWSVLEEVEAEFRK